MRYTALLKGLARQLGYDVEWSPPQLVNGSINPPPTKTYPGLTCYMAQVRVGPNNYSGFGPTTTSAKRFAEFQAYSDLCAKLREERGKERRCADQGREKEKCRADQERGKGRHCADQLVSQPRERVACNTTEHSVPLQPHSRPRGETSETSQCASSQYKGQGDGALPHKECRARAGDEEILTQFAHKCQTYFTMATSGGRRSDIVASDASTEATQGSLASSLSGLDERMMHLSIERSSAREGLSCSDQPTGGGAQHGAVVPCSAVHTAVVASGNPTKSSERAADLKPGLVGGSSVERHSRADQSSDISAMETNTACSVVPKSDDVSINPSLPSTDSSAMVVQSSMTDNPIGQLEELLVKKKLPQPKYSVTTAQPGKGVELFHCVVSAQGFTGNGTL